VKKKGIDPAKARKMAGGGGWYREIAVDDHRVVCSRCGVRTSLVGLDHECLRCRLAHRKTPQA
jgi:hypothetical protein